MLYLRDLALKTLLILTVTLGVTSCVYDSFGDEKEDEYPTPGGRPDDASANVQFAIRALDRASSASGPWERIKYLRIIMLDKSNKIEYNRLISFPIPQSSLGPDWNPDDTDESLDGALANSDFEYVYSTPTQPGQKSFYIIANEQSVSNVNFQWPEGYTPRSGLKNLIQEKGDDLSLTDILTYYSGGFEANFPDIKDEFSTVMNAIWFEPDYSIDENDNIYLPYTAFYTGADFVVEAVKKDESNLFQQFRDMYLVPMATKFTFTFTNKRPSPVYVEGISITSAMPEDYVANDPASSLPNAISAEGFLFAQLENTQVGGKYWIDWLQQAAAGSWNPGSGQTNADVNEGFGWISNYFLPENGSTKEAIWTPDETQAGSWIVSAASLNSDGTVAQAGSLPLGPFYEPESKNMIEREFYVFDKDGNPIYENGQIKTETKEVQAYFLTLSLFDPTAAQQHQRPDFTAVEISELKALFRATHVHIDIVMDINDYGIYAEIKDWNENTAHGTVQEGTPDNIDQNEDNQ